MAKKKINPCIYNDIRVNEDFTRAAVQNDTLMYGLVELPSFKEVIPFKYTAMKGPEEGYYVVSIDGKYGAVDIDGNEVIPVVYEEMTIFGHGRAAVMRDGKVGFIDAQGNLLTDFIYDHMPYDHQMRMEALDMTKDGSAGVVDVAGNEIVPFIYDSCSVKEYQDVYITAAKDGKTALYDMQGKELLALKYKMAEYCQGYVIAGDDHEHCGVVDLQGNVLVPFEYANWSRVDAQRGYFVMKSDSPKSVTLYDLKGEKLVRFPYYDVDLMEDAVKVCDVLDPRTDYGLYDYEGKLLIQVINQSLHRLDGDRYLAQVRGCKEATLIELSSGKNTILPYGIQEHAFDGLFIVSADGKSGVVNSRLETVIPIIYDKISRKRFDDVMSFAVTADGQVAVFDASGNTVLDFGQETDEDKFLRGYDSDRRCSKGYIVRKKNKFGLLDASGNPLGLPVETSEKKPKKKKVSSPICPFTSVRNFSEGFAAVMIDDKWGYIDVHGNLLHPVILSSAGDFKEGLAEIGGVKGTHINTKGEYVTHFKPYDWTPDPVGEPGYIYRKAEGGKKGWVDHEGNDVIPCIYDSDDRYCKCINVKDDTRQYVIVRSDGKYGAFDLHGKAILEVGHDSLSNDQGFWKSTIGGKVALYSPDGKQLTEHKYDAIRGFSGDLVKVLVNRKEGLINKAGKEIVPAEYDSVAISEQGNYVLLRRDWKSGMIDSQGREICPMKYDSLGVMNEEVGLATACIGDGEGYVDTEGREIIPLKYGRTNDFVLGFAEVEGHNMGQCGVINVKGELVMPLQYTKVDLRSFVNEELRIVKVYDEKKIGIFDLLNGTELIAPKFAEVDKYSDGWLAVKFRGKWGFVDLEGNPLDYAWLNETK